MSNLSDKLRLLASGAWAQGSVDRIQAATARKAHSTEQAAPESSAPGSAVGGDESFRTCPTCLTTRLPRWESASCSLCQNESCGEVRAPEAALCIPELERGDRCVWIAGDFRGTARGMAADLATRAGIDPFGDRRYTWHLENGSLENLALVDGPPPLEVDEVVHREPLPSMVMLESRPGPDVLEPVSGERYWYTSASLRDAQIHAVDRRTYVSSEAWRCEKCRMEHPANPEAPTSRCLCGFPRLRPRTRFEERTNDLAGDIEGTLYARIGYDELNPPPTPPPPPPLVKDLVKPTDSFLDVVRSTVAPVNPTPSQAGHIAPTSSFGGQLGPKLATVASQENDGCVNAGCGRVGCGCLSLFLFLLFLVPLFTHCGWLIGVLALVGLIVVGGLRTALVHRGVRGVAAWILGAILLCASLATLVFMVELPCDAIPLWPVAITFGAFLACIFLRSAVVFWLLAFFWVLSVNLWCDSRDGNCSDWLQGGSGQMPTPPLPEPAVRSCPAPIVMTEAALFGDKRIELQESATSGPSSPLSRAVATLQRAGGAKLAVIGHTDRVENDKAGDDTQGVVLSEARARQVAQWLVKHGGMNETLMSVSTKGATDPITDDPAPEKQALNRRVEITIDCPQSSPNVAPSAPSSPPASSPPASSAPAFNPPSSDSSASPSAAAPETAIPSPAPAPSQASGDNVPPPPERERPVADEFGCGETIQLESGPMFDINRGVIKPGAFPKLESLGRLIAGYKHVEIEVVGHSDLNTTGVNGRDLSDWNTELSGIRAESVRSWLIENANVDSKSIRAVGRGAEQPLSTDPKNQEVNRRVEVSITCNRFALTEVLVEVMPHNPEGDSWDPFDGLPDVSVQCSGGQDFSAEDDTLTKTWTFSPENTLAESERCELYDRDLNDPDPIGSFVIPPADAAGLRKVMSQGAVNAYVKFSCQCGRRN